MAGDVLCAGLIVADLVSAPLSRLPKAGELVTTTSLQLTIGGCAANVAMNLARLNVPAVLVARTGEDDLGRFVREMLARSGVDGRGLTVSKTAQTAATQVVNVAGEDRRFIHAVGANAELTGAEVTEELLARASALYVGGFGLNAALSGESVAALFDRARSRGVLTALDVVLSSDLPAASMLQHVLPVTDVFFPNVDEAMDLTGHTTPAMQARDFLEWGAGRVIITQGARGAEAWDQSGEYAAVPAFPSQPVDPTGGGDAFVSGYLWAQRRGALLIDCLRAGAAVGASCVRCPGATTGVYTEAELLSVVAS